MPHDRGCSRLYDSVFGLSIGDPCRRACHMHLECRGDTLCLSPILTSLCESMPDSEGHWKVAFGLLTHSPSPLCVRERTHVQAAAFTRCVLSSCFRPCVSSTSHAWWVRFGAVSGQGELCERRLKAGDFARIRCWFEIKCGCTDYVFFSRRPIIFRLDPLILL